MTTEIVVRLTHDQFVAVQNVVTELDDEHRLVVELGGDALNWWTDLHLAKRRLDEAWKQQRTDPALLDSRKV